jgi:hypothetical protein
MRQKVNFFHYLSLSYGNREVDDWFDGHIFFKIARIFSSFQKKDEER